MRQAIMLMLVMVLTIPAISGAEINLQNTKFGPVQTFIPVPDRSLAPITGTYVFRRGTGGDTDITGWSMILVRPSAAVNYYYNADTTKVKTLPANTDSLIFVGQAGVNQVTITLGANTAQIQGR